MKNYDVVCECCGKPFIAHNTRTRFCSRRCKDIAYKRSKGQDSRLDPYQRQCLVCGKEFETFNPSKVTCSDECSKEHRKEVEKRHWKKHYEHTWEEYVEIQKEKARQNAEIKKIEKAWYTAIHTVERECIICGTLFYCLDNQNKKTCSEECRHKLRNARSDKRIPKDQIIDTDINLERLFRRDEGKCWICGGQCDFNDKSISRSGHEYSGATYPTIDHVVPVSRGGLHSWENVRLAHWKCNTIEKRDNIYPYLPLDKEFAYKEKAKGTQAKQTAQYTLDGQLIRIWDSTAQIERELGLKCKHIQNVCRRHESKTGNAYGYHWEYVDNNVI